MSRVHIELQSKVYAAAAGVDRHLGFFCQVWSNQNHSEDCCCSQCSFDCPELDLDCLDGWADVARCIFEITGEDVTARLVDLPTVFENTFFKV